MQIERFRNVVVCLCAGLIGFGATAAPTQVPTHKLIAAPGVVDETSAGVRLLEDYGSYRLYAVTDAAYSALSAVAKEKSTLADDMNVIKLDAAPLDTKLGAIGVPAALRAASTAAASLHLVQFVGPIRQAWLDELTALGINPVHYIDSNAYLVWASASGRATLDRLAAAGGPLQYSGPYHPYYKLGPSLRAPLAETSAADRPVPVTVQILDHAGKGATRSLIESLSVSIDSAWLPILKYENGGFTVPLSRIAQIAALPDVTWVGERFARTLNDEVQNQIVAGHLNVAGTLPSGTGYKPFLDGKGFSQDPAAYPIVVVTDDGVGDGTAVAGSGDPTFLALGAGATRITSTFNCTTDVDARSGGGHGHINTSIVGGYDARAGAPFQDPDGYQRGQGLSPYGRMATTKIFTNGGGYSVGGCGGTDAGVIAQNYNQGARISTNSWGCSGCAGTYDDGSQAYDAGTRDALPGTAGNQELLFLFAAGNSGPGAATVGTPGNGKNMITVAASENVRPTWSDGCGVGPTGADNAMDVIGFSSRGPSPGGRKKPELIAPGTHIQGTASTAVGYNGGGVCDQFLPTDQSVFAASSGTSHSTPALAGVASLCWRWLQDRYLAAVPSPALTKAYMIAHTRYLTGVGANDTLPSNSQGYGMPDLEMAFDDTVRYLVDQSVLLNNSGETYTFNGSVADPTKPVRIVLAYTDAPGAIGTSPQVNNLDLSATINGTTYLGNVMSGQFSVTGGAADTLNNYEAIRLAAGASGALSFTVTGFGIAGDGVPNTGDATDQDFAVVCYNCAQFPDFTITVNPTSRSVCAPADAVYPITIGSILAFDEPATLTTSGLPGGATTSYSVNPVTPPGASDLTIGTAGVAPGTYPFTLTGTSATKVHSRDLSITIYDAIPAAPSLATPANGATLQPLRPSFSWSASAQAATYELQVATDVAFTNVIHTGSAIVGTTYSPNSDLPSNSQLYWRVRTTNTCGTGGDSAVFGFTTIPLPGDCPMGSQALTVYFDDFESGAAGWTSNGVGNTWALWSTRVNSGTNAQHAVDPTTASDQRLISPAILLPAGQAPLNLIYYNYQSFEDSTTGCFDAGILEISTTGPAGTFTQLQGQLLTDPYDGTINGTGNALNTLQGWCGDPQDWTRTVVDLNAFAGQTVHFRWRLGSDTSVGRPDGWSVDDVKVQSCLSGPDFSIAATPDLREVCAPADASYNLSLQAFAGFAEPITLSGSGLPAGASASFPVNPVTAPTASTMTVTTAGVAPGTYSINAVGTSASQTHSDDVSLAVYDAIPAAPVLTAPADGATNQPVRPVFTWGAVSQAISYSIEIASDAAFTTVIQSASGLATTTYTPPADLQSNAVFYWRVWAVNVCGTGAYSAVFSFATVALPGDCPGGSFPFTLYATDFETGAPGWTSGGTGSTWASSSARAFSGTMSWRATAPGAVSDQQLVSPAITLPGGQNPLALIYQNYQVIERNGTTGCFDGGLIEISSAGPGGPWVQLQAQILVDPYDGAVSGSFSNPLAGKQAWCGDPADWTRAVVDLSAFAGQTVHLRWRLGTDTSVGREGWYLDDVKFQSCSAGAQPFLALDAWRWSDATPPGNNNGVLEPGERATIEVDVRNLGAAPATLVSGQLSVVSGSATLLNATSPYPNVPVTGVRTNTYLYTFDLGNGHPCGTSVTLHNVVSYDGTRSFAHDMTIPTGTPSVLSFAYAGPPVAIPDNNVVGVDVPLNVPASGNINDLDVRIDITHTFDRDLVITLKSPAATSVILSNMRGADANNFTGTIFDDEAATPISAGTAPFTGRFRPEAPLSGLDGQSMTGNWILNVSDRAGIDTGTVNALVLDFTNPPLCAPPLPPSQPPPVPATSLRLDKLTPDGSMVHVTWNSATCPAANYNLHYGSSTQIPPNYFGVYGLAGSRLAIGADGAVGYDLDWNIVDPFVYEWCVVVGTDGVFTEGSWGQNTAAWDRTGPGPGGSSGVGPYQTKVTTGTCP